jgi:hypothetical protein
MQPDLNQEPNSNMLQNPTPQPQKMVTDFFTPQNTSPTTTSSIKDESQEVQLDTASEQSSVQTNQDEPVNTQNTQNEDILLDLKDSRDKLRGAEEVPKSVKRKHKLIALVGFILAVAILSLVAIFIVKPAMKKDEPVQRVGYALPNDLSSKPTEEQAAMQVFKLAREGNSAEIIKAWLGAKDLNTAQQDFTSLINSYKDSADGKSVELIEKKSRQNKSWCCWSRGGQCRIFCL